MNETTIQFDHMPSMRDPLFIAGFDGWGNALDISRGMVDYLIRKLGAKPFARLDPDVFYRFDENRPLVNIEEGLLKSVSPPSCVFYATPEEFPGRDLILLKCHEPQLRWFHFVDTTLTLCDQIGAKTVISLGSMYDSVLHTEMVVSAIASNKKTFDGLKKHRVNTVNYQGPSAIHSLLHREGEKRGFECLSLWCHCPYYLQGTTHFGLMSHLGALLSKWGGFDLDTEELDVTWKDLDKQIQGIIDKNPELQSMISDLRKEKLKGSLSGENKDGKVIHLEDFMRPK